LHVVFSLLITYALHQVQGGIEQYLHGADRMSDIPGMPLISWALAAYWPDVQLLMQVWHPNISSQTGAICLDILKDAWSPALGIKTALISLQLLLQCPAPDDPQDAQVAQQYLNDPKEYRKQAIQWTRMFWLPFSLFPLWTPLHREL
jgi:hypothetical protein